MEAKVKCKHNIEFYFEDVNYYDLIDQEKLLDNGSPMDTYIRMSKNGVPCYLFYDGAYIDDETCEMDNNFSWILAFLKINYRLSWFYDEYRNARCLARCI